MDLVCLRSSFQENYNGSWSRIGPDDAFVDGLDGAHGPKPRQPYS